LRCLRDRAIEPATQKLIHAELPCDKVVSMKTSHSPFPSSPEKLVGYLDSVARL